MNLIRLGKRIINLEYLILAEEWGAEGGTFGPGAIRLTLESGRILDITGGDVETFRSKLEDICPTTAGDRPDSGPPRSAQILDVRTAEPAPPVKRKPKERGR